MLWHICFSHKRGDIPGLRAETHERSQVTVVPHFIRDPVDGLVCNSNDWATRHTPLLDISAGFRPHLALKCFDELGARHRHNEAIFAIESIGAGIRWMAVTTGASRGWASARKYALIDLLLFNEMAENQSRWRVTQHSIKYFAGLITLGSILETAHNNHAGIRLGASSNGITITSGRADNRGFICPERYSTLARTTSAPSPTPSIACGVLLGK